MFKEIVRGLDLERRPFSLTTRLAPKFVASAIFTKVP